jgi:hypothetical protein
MYSYNIDASDLIKKNLGLRERVTGKTKGGYEPAVVLYAFRSYYGRFKYNVTTT